MIYWLWARCVRESLCLRTCFVWGFWRQCQDIGGASVFVSAPLPSCHLNLRYELSVYVCKNMPISASTWMSTSKQNTPVRATWCFTIISFYIFWIFCPYPGCGVLCDGWETMPKSLHSKASISGCGIHAAVVRRCPKAVILVDELETLHPKVASALIPVLKGNPPRGPPLGLGLSPRGQSIAPSNLMFFSLKVGLLKLFCVQGTGVTWYTSCLKRWVVSQWTGNVHYLRALIWIPPSPTCMELPPGHLIPNFLTGGCPSRREEFCPSKMTMISTGVK